MSRVVDSRISSKGYGGESRRWARTGRQPSGAREGACRGHHRGLRAGHACTGGTRERGRATSLRDSIPGLGDRATTGPGVVGGFHPSMSPSGTPRTQEAGTGSGSERERSDPRGVGRQSEHSIVPTKVGNHGPRDPREGRRCRASRSAGETDGRDLEIPNRHTTTPADCGAGRPRSRPRLDDAGPPEGQRCSARGVSPDEQGERSQGSMG
jgi:hypothetical protein